jgi:hypothetical protein
MRGGSPKVSKAEGFAEDPIFTLNAVDMLGDHKL